MSLSFRNRTKQRAKRQPSAGSRKQIYSYYKTDQSEKAGQVGDARKKYAQNHTFLQRLRLLPTLLAVGVIIVSVAYSTTLSTDPIVRFVGDSKKYRSASEYQSVISNNLRSSIFNRNKLTLNTHSQENMLLTAFPELDAVTVSIPVIGRRPTVHIHTRIPTLIINSGNGSFVVDSYGVVIGMTSELSSSLLDQLLTANDKSNLQLQSGKQALTNEAINFVTGVKFELTSKQLEISSLDLIAGGYEIDFHIKNQPYYIKTDSNGDARIQIGEYLAARDNGINPKEYMDVRVEEKVFYK